MISCLLKHLPTRDELQGRYMEPFVGGGAIFFAIAPRKALLSDINPELIDLYKAIRRDSDGVWKAFADFPDGKEAYTMIRRLRPDDLPLTLRAARLLYLNRTCFKGMWRHNKDGEFNVGYGGTSRRWVITQQALLDTSKQLRHASLKCADFGAIIDSSEEGDFIFADPPYRPGHRELQNQHYSGQSFTFQDQKRLAAALKRATKRNVLWTMTNSAHPDILRLYRGSNISSLTKGTGPMPGVLVDDSGEAIISNAG